jgi:methylated-DNA-protein-cysteine methyltransferase related protein
VGTRTVSDVTDFDLRVTAVLLALGEGEVTTYGDVAEVAGYPRRSRAVGALLAAAVADDLPWWRVVRSDGRLAAPSSSGQAELLRAEGVTVTAGRVRDAPIGRFRGISSSPMRRAT